MLALLLFFFFVKGSLSELLKAADTDSIVCCLIIYVAQWSRLRHRIGLTGFMFTGRQEA